MVGVGVGLGDDRVDWINLRFAASPTSRTDFMGRLHNDRGGLLVVGRLIAIDSPKLFL